MTVHGLDLLYVWRCERTQVHRVNIYNTFHLRPPHFYIQKLNRARGKKNRPQKCDAAQSKSGFPDRFLDGEKLTAFSLNRLRHGLRVKKGFKISTFLSGLAPLFKRRRLRRNPMPLSNPNGHFVPQTRRAQRHGFR